MGFLSTVKTSGDALTLPVCCWTVDGFAYAPKRRQKIRPCPGDGGRCVCCFHGQHIHNCDGLPCTHQRSRCSAPALLGGQCVSTIFESARWFSGMVSMYAAQEGYDVSIDRPTVGDQFVIPGRRVNSGSWNDTSINSNSIRGEDKRHRRGLRIPTVLTWIRTQSSSDDGFVFDGIQGASRVDDPTIWLQHAHRALKDTNLKPGRNVVRGEAHSGIFEGTNPCKPLPSKGCQRFQMPTFFRSVPSPLHGTSQRIRSNKS